MCDIEGDKHICILNNLCDCQQPHQHIQLKEKKIVSWYTDSFCEKFFLRKETSTIKNIRIKSLTCFKHQINIIVVIFIPWKLLPSNQLFK